MMKRSLLWTLHWVTVVAFIHRPHLNFSSPGELLNFSSPGEQSDVALLDALPDNTDKSYPVMPAVGQLPVDPPHHALPPVHEKSGAHHVETGDGASKRSLAGPGSNKTGDGCSTTQAWVSIW